MTPAAMLLRIRLLLVRIDPVLASVVVLLLAGVVLHGALVPARARLDGQYDTAWRAARTPLPAPAALAAAPPSSDQNLAQFHAVLGDPRGVERQLKQVFALAERHGLTLQQGDYRATRERDARLVAYQVNLPVKGSYEAVWAFSMDVLRTLPHAALDDVSLRRDSIGADGVEARLRLTLYLAGDLP